MEIKKCLKCGSYVKVFNDGVLKCCDSDMVLLKPNTSDAAQEKHIPNYDVVDGKIKVYVNHVMDSDHYIEWIAISYQNKDVFVYLKPGDEAKAEFDYEDNFKIYAYCNKHNLWMKN